VGDLGAIAKRHVALYEDPGSNKPSAPTLTPSHRTRRVDHQGTSVADPLAVRPVG
jgi:hypothetical protein